MAKEVSISFKFTVPGDEVLTAAQKMAASTNQDERAVGSTVVDLTEETERSMAAVADVASKDTYDLGVYFDYKFGDSLDAAKRLASSDDKEVRYFAEFLISQYGTIVASKAAFQASTKPG